MKTWNPENRVCNTKTKEIPRELEKGDPYRMGENIYKSFATTWMDLAGLMLSELGLTGKGQTEAINILFLQF